jgi:tRNA dimethylallyltransferase
LSQQSRWLDKSESTEKLYLLNRAAIDLHERINMRVEEMFRRGLVEETRELLKHDLTENRNAMQSIGYRQVVEHLRGDELVKIRTRQFAKRQLTWFRRHGNCQWIELKPEESAEIVLEHHVKELMLPEA